MKKLIVFTLAFILVLPSLVLADGMIFPDNNEKISMPEQKAVMMWEDGTETLILSTKAEPEDITDMAWIIPIRSETKPEVEEGDISLFFDLVDMFGYRRGPVPLLGIAEGAAVAEEVSIVEVKMVDVYYIVILQATDATVLVEWLNTHGYYLPEGSEEVLENYVGEDYYFVINRINLANELDEPLTSDDYACADTVSVYLYSEEALEWELEYAFENNDECKDASYDAVKLLKEVELGIETPLKITFEPEIAYYPMVMSSIAEGVATIDLYFLADIYVKDTSGQLESEGRREIPDYIKVEYDIDEDLATYMRYVGKLEDIKEDSYFTEYTIFDRIIEFFGGIFTAILSK